MPTSKKKPSRKKKPAQKKTAGSDARAKAAEKSREWATDRLAATLVEKCIDELRDLQQPWSKTPEAEQTVIIARVTEAVRRGVKEAALAIAARGNKAVICNLFSVTFKDGVRATITMPPGSDMRHELADRATQDVCLVFADPQDFMSGLDEIAADKDQPPLL